MRLSPSHDPLSNPYFWMASNVYWEHVGVYRQLGGIHRVPLWYRRIMKTPKARPIESFGRSP